MDYIKRSWEDGSNAGLTDVLFSDASHFRMDRAARRHIHVGAAGLETSGCTLLSVSSTGHEIGVTDDEALTVMLPVQGWVEVTTDQGVHRAVGGSVMSFRPSRRRTAVRRKENDTFSAYLVKMPSATEKLAWLRGARRLMATDDPFISLRQEPAAALRDLLRYVFADLTSGTPVHTSAHAASLLDVLLTEHLNALFGAPTAFDEAAGNGASRKVLEAEEFMEAHFDEALRVADVAEAVGIGSRALQAAFRAETGRTPWSRLTEIRMRHARLRLLTAFEGGTVTAIALDCGFTHLGRFAESYFATYGERPSETLARRR